MKMNYFSGQGEIILYEKVNGEIDFTNPIDFSNAPNFTLDRGEIHVTFEGFGNDTFEFLFGKYTREVSTTELPIIHAERYQKFKGFEGYPKVFREYVLDSPVPKTYALVFYGINTAHQVRSRDDEIRRWIPAQYVLLYLDNVTFEGVGAKELISNEIACFTINGAYTVSDRNKFYVGVVEKPQES